MLATPLQANPPPCRATQLSAVARLQGATGSALGAIVFRNRTSAGCTVKGYPRVRIETRAGRDLGVKQVPIPDSRPVVLLQARERGGSARIRLAWRNFCRRPAAVFARVTLPDRGGSLRVRLEARPRCDAPDHASTLGVGPFRAG
jgi:hypothetical protein